MGYTSLIKGSSVIDNNLSDTSSIYNNLMSINYDKSMSSRWTASFGKSYDYSGKSYPYIEMPSFLSDMIPDMSKLFGFEPNNCLINLYHDGNSSMGYHSDNTDILYDGTGVIIISIGSTRTLRFRNITNRTDIVDYVLTDGSIFYMDDALQTNWMHSIPRSDSNSIRISLTFRKIL